MRYFRKSKGRVGGCDRGIGGKLLLLGLARVLAFE